MPSNRTVAPGINLIPNLKPPHRTLNFHRYAVLIITFFAYASFHASRKPPSIVKSVLGPTIPVNSSNILPNSTSIESDLASNGTGWAPFDGSDGTNLLGELDLAFLSAYSIGMYFAGHVGDRIDLRLFLVLGMMGSGFFTILFGLGYWLNLHVLWFFISVQIVCGLFQSIGWPCVVAIVGNWFGKAKRGLIMGLWNSHTSVGNIIGSIVASGILEFGWGWSFVVPGGLVILVGIFVFMFIVVDPKDIGFGTSVVDGCEMNPGRSLVEKLENTDSEEAARLDDLNVTELNHGVNPVETLENRDREEAPLLDVLNKNELNTENPVEKLVNAESEKAGLLDVERSDASGVEISAYDSAAIGFLEAWKLPGVAPFAFCLFFSKLVAYTFLYWLPFYIRHTAVGGVHLSNKMAGFLSTIFDFGGICGGVLAGLISDLIDARAVTSATFLLLSIPVVILYHAYGSISTVTNTCLMFLLGLLVNGPYSLITTAVAADLGTQSSIGENSRALATVTAIIDGTGSVGAALGPLMAGYVSRRGWGSVFAMLILSIFFAAIFLSRVVIAEVKEKLDEGCWFSSITQTRPIECSVNDHQ